MRNLHVLAIPYPAQGHVIPLMELSQCLVKHGFKVSFVNTDYIHKRVMDVLAEKDSCITEKITLVSIPDGLEPWEDRNDPVKVSEAIDQVMPGKLEELIDRINASEDDKIVGLIADANVGFALEVAEKLNIPKAAFSPASAAALALSLSIPELISDEIISNDGTLLKNLMIQLAPNMPVIKSANLIWTCMGDLTTQKTIFNLMVKNNKTARLPDWFICNSTNDLEPVAFTLCTNVVPIGPLLASSRLGDSLGCFWPEDTTCLKWLDQQPPNSVVFVAFGSFTVIDQTQFRGLALGLELSDIPFLWVVRPGLTGENGAFPEGFADRVGKRGLTVGWAPQQKVLSHSSIACFVSHCGWNSTLEGVSNGVPFLCWPYFADQYMNESYICDVWKVGLRFDRNKDGIITREEIMTKMKQVVEDKGFKERASQLQSLAMDSVAEAGDSRKNFESFVEWLKNT